MSVVSKTALTTQINTDLASASNITAAEHRGVAKNIVDSYEDLIGSYTTVQIAALVGMTERQIVYNTTDKDYEFYDGTRWVKMAHPKYKVYRAIMNQTGTNAPVATVLDNTLGGTVVWTRTDVGRYVATLSGAFTANKTWIIMGANSNLDPEGSYVPFYFRRVSDSAINVEISVGATYSDDAIFETPFVVFVYY